LCRKYAKEVEIPPYSSMGKRQSLGFPQTHKNE
jgi:hypothetical protein